MEPVIYLALTLLLFRKSIKDFKKICDTMISRDHIQTHVDRWTYRYIEVPFSCAKNQLQ